MGSRRQTTALEQGLQLLRTGSPAAVDRLCAALRPFVEAAVSRQLTARGRRWAEADDLVQGILLEASREFDTLPPTADAEALLRRARRIAACRVKDSLRNHDQFLGESAMDWTRGAAVPGAVGEGSRSTGPVTAADRRRYLEDLVARLPEKYAAVVRLCGLEGLSCVEAAARLGLEPDTVRKRYEVAREALARRLGNGADV